MSVEENKNLVRALLHRVLNGHEVDVVGHLVSPDYVELEPYPGHRGDREGLSDWYGAILTGFPDLSWSMELQLAEDVHVVTIGTTTGTHRGPYFDFPATNRRLAMSWVFLHRIRDGRVVEGRHFPDALAFQQQMGEMPPPGGTRPKH